MINAFSFLNAGRPNYSVTVTAEIVPSPGVTTYIDANAQLSADYSQTTFTTSVNSVWSDDGMGAFTGVSGGNHTHKTVLATYIELRTPDSGGLTGSITMEVYKVSTGMLVYTGTFTYTGASGNTNVTAAGSPAPPKVTLSQDVYRIRVINGSGTGGYDGLAIYRP